MLLAQGFVLAKFFLQNCQHLILGRTAVCDKRQGLLVAPLPACELPTARDCALRKTSVFFLKRQFFAKTVNIYCRSHLLCDKRQGLLVAPLPACELPTARDWSGGEAVDRRSKATRTMSVSEPRKARFLQNASAAKSRP